MSAPKVGATDEQGCAVSSRMDLTAERRAITRHLVPVMAPQLLWHSLSPVILGQTASFSVFFFLSLSLWLSSTWLCLDLLPVVLCGIWRPLADKDLSFFRVFSQSWVSTRVMQSGSSLRSWADRIVRWGGRRQDGYVREKQGGHDDDDDGGLSMKWLLLSQHSHMFYPVCVTWLFLKMTKLII